MKIGFIGLGVMGNPMAGHLLKAGHDMYLYTRTKDKCVNLIQKGATWCEDVPTLASLVDVVITMVGFPQDVEEVYFGHDGIIENAKEGTYLIDMTTTSPKLSKKIFEEAQKRHLHALDAPVSGGDKGAHNGTLAIMVGGMKEDFDQMMPIFKLMGTNIKYAGVAGSGQHTKMANQIAIAGTLAGTVEALTYAKKSGLDLQNLLDTISTGAAGSWQLTNQGQKIIQEDFNPGFFIKHFIKDMTIADEEAKNVDLTLEVLEKVLAMQQTILNEGGGELGTQALIKYYEKF